MNPTAQPMPDGLSNVIFPDAPKAERAAGVLLRCQPSCPGSASIAIRAETVAPACPSPASSPPEQPLRAELAKLVTQWEQRCERKFASAKAEPTEHGRRFIEHGAVNLHNCAAELRAVLERQAGNAARDLELEVIKQNTERPWARKHTMNLGHRHAH